ncbi:hypothetical protein ANCDUO_06427 [Ancylostoma duodenale]|uniref:SCP domain-containing protein n=1 Tax=Ancylostoma duodenale TaxID=51022 RepID=A0A0C2GW50_9BILA|nr:hypothetical protein ANCDUO_06427 [Ancylostoma duodenale]
MFKNAFTYILRAKLARGLVRNGKEGNPNCPTATNMYEMRYDMAMEIEAQAYANSCPEGGSLPSTRPYSGENNHTFYSLIISNDEAITNVRRFFRKYLPGIHLQTWKCLCIMLWHLQGCSLSSSSIVNKKNFIRVGY